MQEVNTLVLANKVYWLSSLGDGYHSDSPSGSNYFGLNGHNYDFFGVYKVKYKEVPSSICMGNKLSILYQDHCRKVIVVSDPSFSKLTK